MERMEWVVMILREASSHRSALRRTWHACPARHTDSPRHDSCFAAAPQNGRNRTITKTNQTTKSSAAPHNACTRPRAPSSVGETRESPKTEAAPEILSVLRTTQHDTSSTSPDEARCYGFRTNRASRGFCAPSTPLTQAGSCESPQVA